MFYRQCALKSDNATTIAWLNDEGALKLGNKVTFKDVDDKQWWTITFVGETRMPEKIALARERQYLKHRKASDI